jgi:putative proteasome-type protease
MTFCLGMTVHDGLVGIADNRITSGKEVIQARKVSSFETEQGCFFIMTSGLRSVRDKTMTYFREHMNGGDESLDRLFKAVNILTRKIRKVSQEDKPSLEESGLSFDIHCLVGGQMSGDREHSLYLVYPEGNWVEVGKGTPYQIIGAPGYGKPILDRTLNHEDSLAFALKVGFLAFDSSRISAADVDFPVDVVLYKQGTFKLVEHLYERDDFWEISEWWDGRLKELIKELPSEWIDRVWSKLWQLET